MWIVAIAWIYVVVLMAATETSIVAGIMTLLGYCVLPLSIVFYITGTKQRRARKAAAASAAAPGATGSSPANPDNSHSTSSAAAPGGAPGNRGDGGSGDGD